MEATLDTQIRTCSANTRTLPLTLQTTEEATPKAPVCEHAHAVKLSRLHRTSTAFNQSADLFDVPQDLLERFVAPERPTVPVARFHSSVIFFTVLANATWALMGPALGAGRVNAFCALGSLLVIAIETARYLRMRDVESKARREFVFGTLAWQEAVRRWDRLYYCPTCRDMYDLETGHTEKLETRRVLEACA